MDNNTSYDKMVRTVKSVRLPDIDSAPRIMERIRKSEQERGAVYKRSGSYRTRLWIATSLMLLITAVSVSAAVSSFPFSWNGIEIATYRLDPAQRKPGELTDIERIDRELQARKEWKTITLEEAGSQFQLPVLRPKATGLAPSRSFGVVASGPFEKPLSADDLHIDGFHDFFEKGKEWIVVTQKVSKRESGAGMRVYYPDDWEIVKVDDQILTASYGNDTSRNLELWIMSDETNQRVLHLSGNVSKDQLEKLAEAYVGKSLKP